MKEEKHFDFVCPDKNCSYWKWGKKGLTSTEPKTYCPDCGKKMVERNKL